MRSAICSNGSAQSCWREESSGGNWSQAQEFEAQGFAGLWATGGDVERRGKRSGLEAVGVEGPEGEEVELFRGTREVLAVEIGDLVDERFGSRVEWCCRCS